MKLSQLQGLKFTAVIPSDFAIQSGYVVNLKLPLKQPDRSGTAESMDNYRTAKYLVSAVHHGISGDISSTTLELLTDSFNQQLPTADNSSTALQNMRKS
jgi:hypothetical protein